VTNRERIVATLKCEPTDRPPLIEWLGTVGWSQTIDRWRDESGIADLELATFFGYDRGFLEAPVQLGPWPHFETTTLEEGEEYHTYVDWRGITMKNRQDGNTLPNYIANPVVDSSDWRRYRSDRLGHDTEGRTAGIASFAGASASIDAPIQIGSYPFGCFGTPRDVLGVEHLLISYYDAPEMVQEIVDTYVDMWLDVYTAVAAHVQIDHVHIWEDMSGKQGSLISMEMVERFMMPSYDRIAEFCVEHSVSAFSVDTDGYVPELVKIMHAHGVSSFFPFEVQAGNDVVATRKQYPDMSVWGGLDKRAPAAGREQMHRELDKAQELFAIGGYVVGFDHAVPPDVPWKNFRYFMTELKKIVGV
jgi:hypothetical protein